MPSELHKLATKYSMDGFFFLLFFPFLFIIFNFIQTEKKELQSTSQAVHKTFGILSLLKQKDSNDPRENLAAAWATELHSLLTQQKRQLRKDSLTHKMLLIILATDQSGEQSKEARGSSKLSHSHGWVFLDSTSTRSNRT